MVETANSPSSVRDSHTGCATVVHPTFSIASSRILHVSEFLSPVVHPFSHCLRSSRQWSSTRLKFLSMFSRTQLLSFRAVPNSFQCAAVASRMLILSFCPLLFTSWKNCSSYSVGMSPEEIIVCVGVIHNVEAKTVNQPRPTKCPIAPKYVLRLTYPSVTTRNAVPLARRQFADSCVIIQCRHLSWIVSCLYAFLKSPP